jgi:pimeloyl-ACP methyl ester carboxylesterase
LVALHYTALHPEKVLKLVVVDTGIPAVETRKSKSIWGVWADALRGFGIHIEDDKLNDIEYLIQKSKELRQEREKSGKAYKSDLNRFVHLARNTSILNDFRAVAGFTFEKIKEVSNPVMANYGEDSHCMDSCRYLCENLPNCKPLIIPNIGHLHPLEYPEEFVENVREFLLEP